MVSIIYIFWQLCFFAQYWFWDVPKLIHVALVDYFSLLYHISMYKNTTLCLASSSWWGFRLSLVSTVSKHTINVLSVLPCVPEWRFLGSISRSGIASSRVHASWVLSDNVKLLSEKIVLIYSLNNSVWEFYCSIF